MKNYIKIIVLIFLISIIVSTDVFAIQNIFINQNMEELDSYFINDYAIKKETKNINIPFKTIEIEDNDLIRGTRKVITEGIDGINAKTYRLILKSGVEIDRESISEEIYKKPMNKVVLVGNRDANKITEETLYFITDNLHLKQEPTSNSDTLVTIPSGTHLDYISTEENWYKVTYLGKIGYVDSSSVNQATGYKVDNTLIVNKGYELSSDFNPGINPEALDFVNKMIKDAKKEGLSLNIFSDFRSYNYQVGVFNKRVKKNGKAKVELYYSRPGYSEHQTGLAFDIGGANSKYYTSRKFGEMEEGLWMAENAHKYGLILRYPKGKDSLTGYQYEPWHFRYVGVDLAKKIKDSDLTLDEYFNVVTPNY